MRVVEEEGMREAIGLRGGEKVGQGRRKILNMTDGRRSGQFAARRG